MRPNFRFLTLTLLCASMPALALDFKPTASVDGKLSGTVTFGTMIRTESADPSVYALPPSSVVPSAAPGGLVGQTGGADLNFRKNRPVSTVLKALVDFDLHNRNVGVFARGSAWEDFTLGHASAAYGNFPNSYQPNTALSDHEFSREARFNGVDLLDAYVYANADLASGSRLDVRVGRQVLNWGTSQFLTGGINSALNPQNYAAQVRPGALPQEGKVPVGMVDLHLTIDKHWSAEGFVPWEARQNVLPGCGTFFDIASVVARGCMLSGAIAAPIPGTPLSTLSSLTEQSILASGYYVHRSDDVTPRGSGQGGVALHFKSEALATDFGLVATNTHSAAPVFRVTIEDVNGATLPAGLAGGLARLADPNGLRYAAMYPQNIHMFGGSFNTKLAPTANVFGEIAYRPNQPLAMNANDLLNASLLRTPTSLIQLHSNILAIPAGGSFDAYDRFKVTTASVGANKVIPAALGAARLVLSAEVGISHIAGLPDPQVMRYGRPLAYGTAPYLVNGTLTPCSESAPGLNGVVGKTCTTDGFTTENAWGLRMRAAATYANALFGAALTPSLLIARDISGYSFDGTYSAGRSIVRLGLRADWGKTVYTDLQYTNFSGGNYNLLTDRNNVMIAAGLSF